MKQYNERNMSQTTMQYTNIRSTKLHIILSLSIPMCLY
jgi:hypothetical protein